MNDVKFRLKAEIIALIFLTTILLAKCGWNYGHYVNWVEGTFPQYFQYVWQLPNQYFEIKIPDLVDASANRPADNFHRVVFYFERPMLISSFNPDDDLGVSRCLWDTSTMKCIDSPVTYSVRDALQKTDIDNCFNCCAKSNAAACSSEDVICDGTNITSCPISEYPSYTILKSCVLKNQVKTGNSCSIFSCCAQSADEICSGDVICSGNNIFACPITEYPLYNIKKGCTLKDGVKSDVSNCLNCCAKSNASACSSEDVICTGSEVTSCPVDEYPFHTFLKSCIVQDGLKTGEDCYNCCAQSGQESCSGDVICASCSIPDYPLYSIIKSCKFEDGTDSCSNTETSYCSDYSYFWDSIAEETINGNEGASIEPEDIGDRLTVVLDPDFILTASPESNKYAYFISLKSTFESTPEAGVKTILLENDPIIAGMLAGMTISPNLPQDIMFIGVSPDHTPETMPFFTRIIPAHQSGLQPDNCDNNPSLPTFPPHGDIYLESSDILFMISSWVQFEAKSKEYVNINWGSIINEHGEDALISRDKAFSSFMPGGFPLNSIATIWIKTEDTDWWDMLNAHKCTALGDPSYCKPINIWQLKVPLTKDWNGTLTRRGSGPTHGEYPIGSGVYSDLFGTVSDTTAVSTTSVFRTSPIRVNSQIESLVVGGSKVFGVNSGACMNFEVDYLPNFYRKPLNDECSSNITQIKMELLNSYYIVIDDSICTLASQHYTEYGSDVYKANCSLKVPSSVNDTSRYFIRVKGYNASSYVEGMDQIPVYFSNLNDDSDEDGVKDSDELKLGTNACLTDSDHNGISDYYDDNDGDGLPNYQELVYETDPNKIDSDDDDILDNIELIYNTDPNEKDTDGDGYSDWEEILNNTDPLNISEYPVSIALYYYNPKVGNKGMSYTARGVNIESTTTVQSNRAFDTFYHLANEYLLGLKENCTSSFNSSNNLGTQGIMLPLHNIVGRYLNDENEYKYYYKSTSILNLTMEETRLINGILPNILNGDSISGIKSKIWFNLDGHENFPQQLWTFNKFNPTTLPIINEKGIYSNNPAFVNYIIGTPLNMAENDAVVVHGVMDQDILELNIEELNSLSGFSGPFLLDAKLGQSYSFSIEIKDRNVYQGIIDVCDLYEDDVINSDLRPIDPYSIPPNPNCDNLGFKYHMSPSFVILGPDSSLYAAILCEWDEIEQATVIKNVINPYGLGLIFNLDLTSSTPILDIDNLFIEKSGRYKIYIENNDRFRIDSGVLSDVAGKIANLKEIEISANSDFYNYCPCYETNTCKCKTDYRLGTSPNYYCPVPSETPPDPPHSAYIYKYPDACPSCAPQGVGNWYYGYPYIDWQSTITFGGIYEMTVSKGTQLIAPVPYFYSPSNGTEVCTQPLVRVRFNSRGSGVAAWSIKEGDTDYSSSFQLSPQGDEIYGEPDLSTTGNHALTVHACADLAKTACNSSSISFIVNDDPCFADTDGDGMSDAWETDNGLDPNDPSDAVTDSDNDGLTNYQEYLNNTDPNNADIDGDNLKDGDEIANGCDPTKSDTDDDGLNDKAEIVYGTQCNKDDTDGDEMHDGWELYFGLNPNSAADKFLDNLDEDGLDNYNEFEKGTNPKVQDSDGDGLSDGVEVGMTNPTRDPALHEEPIIFAIFPGVAKVGDNITIMGSRLRDGANPVQTIVTINGVSVAAIDCAAGDTVTICATIPEGADNPMGCGPSCPTKPIKVTATIGGVAWESTLPNFPYLVVPNSATIKPELDPGPTDLALFSGDAIDAYGLIRYADKDYYRLSIPELEVVTITAQAFDVFGNVTVVIGSPDTYLELTDKNADPVASNDNAPGTTNSALTNLVLDPGTYYIMVSVPDADSGNTSQGYYKLSVSSIDTPYITDISPAIGPADYNEFTIKGVNLDQISVASFIGAYEYPATIHSGSTCIQLDVSLTGSTGDKYDIFINSVDSNQDFYILNPLNMVPEHAIGSAPLKEGETGVGIAGDDRGRFSFSGNIGDIIMSEMAFYDYESGIISGSPMVALKAPDGSTVVNPAMSASGNTVQAKYTLPQTGNYTLIAQDNAIPPAVGYYKLFYSFQSLPTVSSIVLTSTDYRIVPVVKGGTTIFEGVSALVKNGSTPVADYPVIFKSSEKEYLALTDASGIATATNIRTEKPPIQNRIVITPASHPELKAKFNYVLVEAYSRDDWDGDGTKNIDDSNPFNIDSDNDGILDGYPLSPAPALDDDADGLGNSVEIVLDTNPSALDSDSDGYPDGFEITHNLDPLNADSVNIKLIPLGFVPQLSETIKLHALVRDYAGHIRNNMTVTASQGNLLEPFTKTDARGISSGIFLTQNSANGFYPIGDAEPARGFLHNITLQSGTATDTMYFVAKTSVELDPVSAVDGVDSDKIYPESYGGCLRVRTKVGSDPTPSTPIRFSVLEPQSPPAGFENAKFSKRYTPTVSPFDYPNPYLVIGAEPGDAVDSITVYADKDGYASACFYYGNTDNFWYQFKAKLVNVAPGTGDSVTMTRMIGNRSAAGLMDDVHKAPLESALAGTTVPLFASVIYVDVPSSCVSLTEPCVMSASMVTDEPDTILWYGKLGSEPTILDSEVASATVDNRGIATAYLNIPQSYAGQTLYLGFRADWWWELMGLEQIKQISVKTVADFTVTMRRYDDHWAPTVMIDGGTVCPSRDQYISVEITNPTSYNMKLKLVDENNVLDPATNTPQYRENEIVVFPGTKEYYFYVRHPRISVLNEEIAILFKLFDKEETVLIKTMNLDLTNCNIGEMITKYDAAYINYILPDINRLWGCGYFRNIQSQAQVACIHYSEMVESYFKTIFCTNGQQCSNCTDCSFYCHERSCSKVSVVMHGSECQPHGDPRWPLRRELSGSTIFDFSNDPHVWVQVGFKNCGSSEPIKWRNYDAWWDTCAIGGPFIGPFDSH